MDTEEELNFAPEEPSAQAKILPIVVLSLLALTIGMTVYLFLDLRSTKAEFAAQMKQLKVHEEQILVRRAFDRVCERSKHIVG